MPDGIELSITFNGERYEQRALVTKQPELEKVLDTLVRRVKLAIKRINEGKTMVEI